MSRFSTCLLGALLLAAISALPALPAIPATAPAPSPPSAPGAPAPPAAFELLAQVRASYAGLPSYRDHGEIEPIAATGGTRRRFETVVRSGGAFRFTLETGAGLSARRQVLWGDSRRAFQYDSSRGAFRPSPSWLSDLVTLLGEGGFEALVVPSLLAGGPEALPDPSAATVEGPVPCDGASCWQLRLTPFGGGLELRLWVDRSWRLIRQVEVRPDGASPGGSPGAGSPAALRVVHHLDAVGAPVADADLAFAPPPGTPRVAGWPAETAADAGGGSSVSPSPAGAAAGNAEFGEVVNVQLFSLAVRVVDRQGNPVLGLKPADFRARVGSVEVPVAAADWFSSAASPAEAATPETAVPAPGADSLEKPAPALPPISPPSEPGIWPPEPPLPSEGQLVVFFVQADINSASRIRGHLATLPYARDILDTLQPADRVAVVEFDSHLKLQQDFTRDRAAAFAALGRSVHFGSEPPDLSRWRGEPVSLARHFDEGAAKAAATPEQGLRVLGEALTPLSGEKTIVYLGWGLGHYIFGVGVRGGRDYGPAVAALGEARATVFVLDITVAAEHDLAFGLEAAAEATGGTYAKTVDFPAQAAKRLSRVISGYYILSFDVERLRAGGLLSVELKDPGSSQLHYRPVTID